jgi:hypothetical protein
MQLRAFTYLLIQSMSTTHVGTADTLVSGSPRYSGLCAVQLQQLQVYYGMGAICKVARCIEWQNEIEERNITDRLQINIVCCVYYLV